MIKYLLLAFLAFSLSMDSSFAQKKKKKKKKGKTEQTDSKASKKGGMKSYSEIITKDAITDEGLIDVHKVDDKHYFEISKDLLGKEILIVSRVSLSVVREEKPVLSR